MTIERKQASDTGRAEAKWPRVRGLIRDGDRGFLVVAFERDPSDDEMRALHEHLTATAQASDTGRGEAVEFDGALNDAARAFIDEASALGAKIDGHLWNNLKRCLKVSIGMWLKRRTHTPASEDRAGKDGAQAIALHEAVAAIYFADSSDYESALWQVVKALDPDMVKVLEEAPRIAFDMTNEAAEAAREDGQS